MIDSAFTLAEAQHEIETLLRTTPISNQPAIVLEWNREALDVFVHCANTLVFGSPGVPVLPTWMKAEPPHVTIESITLDTAEYLAKRGGANFGRVMIVPDSVSAYSNMFGATVKIESHPFVQVCAKSLPKGKYLGAIAVVEDKSRLPLQLGYLSADPKCPYHPVFGGGRNGRLVR
ncbi:hypothetical protein Poli38472_008755 [Pythium oligandrum]|uniref:Uncharacterized protein n=1 Tax=Pythium oligandrum TaxID=41045 RepID=A0A8K1C434_PYTOL|nr:hypothetical protein Poli38472_008755 [Pythium oligandrum]|eukprot:TMW56107.1 hypothetical protein Poli38472_008755 [Pythium oligandrum]